MSHYQLEKEGLRNPLISKDPSVYKKTKQEKKELKKLKLNTPFENKNLTPNADKSKVNCPKRLTIHVKNKGLTTDNSKKAFKTTYSFTCMPNEIPNHINEMINKRLEITKMIYNGKVV
jgi:hypothetical protein